MLWTILVILLVLWLLGFGFHVAGRCPVQNYALTNEEELVLKSLAAGLKEEEIRGVLLDPADAPLGFHVESLLSKLG